MLQSYDDILALTDKNPLWYDECGVPRFCKFHPNLLNCIYASEAVLYAIACQNCGEKFIVADSWFNKGSGKYYPKLSDSIKSLHYGDPPFHQYQGQNCVGNVENCDDLRIIEFWQKNSEYEWERRPEFEIELGN